MTESLKRWDNNETAAQWAARIERGSLSDAENSELSAWLEQDVRNKGALARAMAIVAMTEKALADCDDLPSELVYPTRSRIARRSVFAALSSIAAALALFLLFKPAPDIALSTYQTIRGEVRALPLPDGSVVTLNTDSSIEVRYSATVREILLRRGEVLFDVAKDTKRPFLVTTDSTTVRAVGTSFVVRDLPNMPVEVLVREGVVDMFRHQRNDQVLRVPANARAVALEIPIPSVKLVETALDPSSIASRLAWRGGMIALEDTTLTAAAAEFNRYSGVNIVVDDPRVGELTVSGLFSVHDPVRFARSVAVAFDLQINVQSDRVMLWK